MRSKIKGTGFLAGAVLCGTALLGCNAVEDVREEPFTPVPTPNLVLSGEISGISTKRAVELQNNGANPRKFFATRGSSVTPLDVTVPLGSSYNITVKTQPFGRICTVANGTGVASASSPGIAVTCVSDPAIPRFPLTVTIPAAVSSLSNLALTLETEDGIQTVDATGLSTYTFPDAVFNALSNVPAFLYKVTATTETMENGLTIANNCLLTSPVSRPGVTGRPGMNITTVDNVENPAGAVNMSITGCSFTVAGTIAYSTPPGGTAQPVGAMTLGLKHMVTGEVGQTVTTTAGATTFSFPTPVLSNSTAYYEIVVASQPAGQFCTVSGNTATTVWSTTTVSTLGSSISAPTAGAVLLLDPVVPDWWAFAGRNVRCRAVPAPANQLTGVYQMDRPPRQNPDDALPARPREFLAFFADGTFLYGINYTDTLILPAPFISSNSNSYVASGVINGFYNYNPGAATIAFSVLTATNISPMNHGLNGMPGYSFGTVTASGVVKTPGALNSISLTFTGNLPAPAPGRPATATGSQTKTLTMTEPESIDGEITGTWVTEDHRRVLSYNKVEIFLFHMGVNGVGNMQDACLLPDDNSTQSQGFIARRAGSTFNCFPGGQFRSPDLPNWTVASASSVFAPTVIRLPTDLNLGRFPGTKIQLDNRPSSPVSFEVMDNSGTPDTLTVQNTLNGALIEQPITFVRYRVN